MIFLFRGWFFCDRSQENISNRIFSSSKLWNFSWNLHGCCACHRVRMSSDRREGMDCIKRFTRISEHLQSMVCAMERRNMCTSLQTFQDAFWATAVRWPMSLLAMENLEKLSDCVRGRCSWYIDHFGVGHCKSASQHWGMPSTLSTLEFAALPCPPRRSSRQEWWNPVSSAEGPCREHCRDGMGYLDKVARHFINCHEIMMPKKLMKHYKITFPDLSFRGVVI